MGDELWLQNMKRYLSVSDIELMDHFPGPYPYPQSPIDLSTTPATTETHRKRKAIGAPANCSAYSSPDNNTNRIQNTKKRLGKGKKARTDEGEDETQRDVVHVRARRGQATDRHSLAERVRRKKINERLKCLQDIVPGCYKAMGMAVMLDEIINYVQSLQTQVEFLSTRLTTASAFHDFNPNGNAFDTMQRANTFDALNFENIAMEGVSSSSPLGRNFGYCPQLPRNT